MQGQRVLQRAKSVCKGPEPEALAAGVEDGGDEARERSQGPHHLKAMVIILAFIPRDERPLEGLNLVWLSF